jgi:hypothetical protein
VPPLPADQATAPPSSYQQPGQPGGGNPPAQGYPYQAGAGQQAYPGAQPYESAQPGSQPYQGGQGYQGTQPYQSAQPYQQAQSYQQSQSYQAGQPYQQTTQAYQATQPFQAAQGQQGYPGGPAAPPGAAWPGAATPPRRKRSRGMLLGITAIIAAVVAGVVTSLVLVLGNSESPTEMALQAGQAVAPSSGLTASGTYDRAPANVTVTKAGTVEGSYSQGPFQVSRITINGVTYLNAPAGFWNLQTNIPQGASSLASGKWAKTPSSDVADFTAFTPGVVSRVLEHVGNQPRFVDTTLNGTKAIKLTTAGVSYYITTSAPNRLLRMDGTIDGTAYSLTVTPLTSKSIAPVFSVLHSDVQDLQGALDPEAQIDEQGNGNFGSNCNNNAACTVSVKVSVTDAGSTTVLVKMTANFSGAKNGPTFGSCNNTVTANTANSSTTVTVQPSCTLGGSTWSGWFNSHTSNFFLWVATQSEPTVNTASDIAALQTTLNQEQG